MDIPTESVIGLLTYLLPGFITAAVVYSLTPNPRPIPFERIVQALIYTMLVQVSVLIVGTSLRWLGTHTISIGDWTDQVRVTWSVVLAFVIGLVVAWAANTDRIHGLLRTLRVTSQTSFSSEWYGVFCRNQGYIVLHLSGSRRLYGWAEEWPSSPDQGHFVVTQAEWLDDGNQTALTGVDRIVVRAIDVEMVEMMKVSIEQKENTDGNTEATDASPRPPDSGLQADGRRKAARTAASVQAVATATATREEVGPASRTEHEVEREESSGRPQAAVIIDASRSNQ